jgi:hypothetical protein
MTIAKAKRIFGVRRNAAMLGRRPLPTSNPLRGFLDVFERITCRLHNAQCFIHRSRRAAILGGAP